MFITECIVEFLPNNSGKSWAEYKQAIQLEITKYLYWK
jgi:hypothetical protein